MRTPGEMADALEAADLRALAARPTGEDVKVLRWLADVLDSESHRISQRQPGMATQLRDLAARLAAQQSAPAEEPAASSPVLPALEASCSHCKGSGSIPSYDRDVQPDWCVECEGVGKQPTPAGRALLAFVREWLRR